jgi:hypothetical protein
MSDYLSRLAARSLKLIGVIRPRLRSIFEPPNFTAISEEDCLLENTSSKPQAARQLSHSPHLSQSPQHPSNQHLPDQPLNLNTAAAMDYPAVVRLQQPTEKPETNEEKEAGCKDLSAIGRAGADRIESMDFLNGNSEGSALHPLNTEAIKFSLPNQTASFFQDHQMPASSAEGSNHNANEKLEPNGLADSRIGPKKASPQAYGQEIQAKATALKDEAAGDISREGITGVEHPNTENRQNHHSGQTSDASSLSLNSSNEASSGESLRKELSLKSDGCRVQNDLSQERPILSDRNVKMPLAEERRQSSNQSLRDHSSLKAPDDFHSEAEPESMAEDLSAGVDLELTKPCIKNNILHREDSNRTERQALMPPIESGASFEKKLLPDPISPIDFFRAAEAVQESNSEYGKPEKSTDRLSATGNALSEAEAHALKMAIPRDSPLPSYLPSREISGRDEPDTRIPPCKIGPISPNLHLQDSQSLRTVVALSRGIQEDDTVILRINLASEGDDAWEGEDSNPKTFLKKSDQHSGEHANPASRSVPIASAQETIPYANPSIQDHIHADPIRPESDEPGPKGIHLIGHRQKIGNNSIDELANRIPLPEKKLQIINQIHQLPQSSKAALSQIGPIEEKDSAELLPSRDREGFLPSGQIDETAESPSVEDPWLIRDRAASREPIKEGSNELEPEAQMLWPEKTPQIINQIHQLPQSSKAALSQIGPIEEKDSAELLPSRDREGFLPSGQIDETAESPSVEDPWLIRDRAASREPIKEGSNELEPEAQMLWPEKTPQIINQIHQLPQSLRAALSQIGSIEEKDSAELLSSRAREGFLPSVRTSTTVRVRADENFDGPRSNLSVRNNPLNQPSSWTNNDRIQLEDLDDKIGLSLIKDFHSNSNRISTSESDGDDLFLPSSRRSAMTRISPDIQSPDQILWSRMDHSPGRRQKNAYTIGGIVEPLKRSERTEKQLHASQPHASKPHAYESPESVAISKKRHSSPLPAAIKSRKAFSERKVEESRDENTAPSVRVTIGRIEVRAAIAPEKPAEKARPKIQILSLDDYLRLRNGGQR